MTAGLEFRGVVKRYGANDAVVKGLDLKVEPGEFMVLVGASGCGKSTTLRMLAGLEELSEGQIFIGQREVSRVAPAERGVAMVFQSYALYPHMTVAENMGFGLRMMGLPKAEVAARVGRAAQSLQLEALLARRPRELSGGQRQRVAIGRAIVREPEVFLFDEPLSNLDAALRHQMRLELAQLHKRLGATIVYVTHDQVEAMTLGDRMAVFNAGRIEQVGAPMDVYARPVNRFVAGFLGSPRINFLEGHAADGMFHTAQAGSLMLAQAGPVHSVGLRPEHLRLVAPEAGWGLRGELALIEHLGDTSIAYLRLAGAAEPLAVKLEAAQGQVLRPGEALCLQAEPQHLLAFDAQGCTL